MIKITIKITTIRIKLDERGMTLVYGAHVKDVERIGPGT